MKKLKLISLLSIGFLSVFGILLGVTHNATPLALHADEEDSSEVIEEEPAAEAEEVFECKVVLEELKHGEIAVDKKEGHVGDLVTIDANADLFYLIKNVSVNGTALIEDEEIRGRFVFALVEGDNLISATFIIDQELLGEMSGMIEQASNKDWTNLFSLKNLIALVSFILNGGILIAIVRYFIRDKKLVKKVESKVESTVKAVLPDATKEIVLKTIEDLIAPYFAKIEGNVGDIQETMVVFCRCVALMQENTPESRIAITKELSSLKLSDKASISVIENKLNAFLKEQGDKMAEVLLKLNNMKAENKEIIEQSTALPEEEPEPEVITDNGIQI